MVLIDEWVPVIQTVQIRDAVPMQPGRVGTLLFHRRLRWWKPAWPDWNSCLSVILPSNSARMATSSKRLKNGENTILPNKNCSDSQLLKVCHFERRLFQGPTGIKISTFAGGILHRKRKLIATYFVYVG